MSPKTVVFITEKKINKSKIQSVRGTTCTSVFYLLEEVKKKIYTYK